MVTEKTYSVAVSKRKFKVILHPDLENGGYWVECPELPGCSSQGDSIEEALDMIKDTIE
jgi:predicted RNase H-like HicB family nuclease